MAEQPYYHYHVPTGPNGEEWADVTLREDMLLFAVSPLGHFSFWWDGQNGGDVRRFILQVTPDYLQGKFEIIQGKAYDGAATLEQVRALIRKGGEEGVLGEDEVTRLEHEVDECSELSSSMDFGIFATRAGKLWEVGDVTPVVRNRMAERFCSEVFPRLQEMIRAELAAEEKRPRLRCWSYRLGSEEDCQGWAQVVLRSDGFFAVVSDFGNYAHHWSLWGGDFRRSLVGFSSDYVYEKITLEGGKEYDGEATFKNVRSHILETWRSFPKSHLAWAKKEMKLLLKYDRLAREEDYNRWYNKTSISDAYELRQDTHFMAQSFCRRTLPRLKAAIRNELAAEASRR